jgi:hypothetical protein
VAEAKGGFAGKDKNPTAPQCHAHIPETLLDGPPPDYDTFLRDRRGLMAQRIKTWFETL